jgi:hypothetical protein
LVAVLSFHSSSFFSSILSPRGHARDPSFESIVQKEMYNVIVETAEKMSNQRPSTEEWNRVRKVQHTVDHKNGSMNIKSCRADHLLFQKIPCSAPVSLLSWPPHAHAFVFLIASEALRIAVRRSLLLPLLVLHSTTPCSLTRAIACGRSRPRHHGNHGSSSRRSMSAVSR